MTSLYNSKSRSTMKKSIFITVIILFVFILYLIMLRYEVEGENIENMPFKVSSITLASKIDTKKNEDSQHLWNFNITQINDLYITVEKNENENNNENIKNIKIQNISPKENKIGKGKVTRIAENNSENENIKSIEFVGKTNSSLENLTVAKTGGTVGFRYLIDNIGPYISNEDEIVYDLGLLEKIGYSKKDIQTKISFDLVLELENNIKYVATIQVQVPTEKENVEKLDISEIIFKRLLQN